MLRVAYSFPNRIGVPGIGTTAWHQVQELVAAGVRVTLFCGSCERRIPGIHQVVETMKLGGVKIPFRIVGNRRAQMWHDCFVAKVLRQREGELDVIHCWPAGSLKTLLTAQQLGIHSFLERPNTHTAFAFQIVADEHSIVGLPMRPKNTHAFDAWRLKREEAEFSAADALLCPSDFVAKTFLKRGFTSNQIVRHQYGYDQANFVPLEGARSINKDRPFTAIFVGRCEPRKGLHYALQAWHDSGAAAGGRFLICGSYIDGYRELLRHWVDHPSVQELGFVSNVAELMQQSDVLILPAVEEGSALVTYEARGAGCVLLVSSATGAVCSDNCNAMVHEPRDVAALTAHLRLLYRDRDRLRAMRDDSLKTLSELTWHTAGARLVAIFKEALQGKLGPQPTASGFSSGTDLPLPTEAVNDNGK